MALKLYFRNDAAPYMPTTVRGAWDDSSSFTAALGTSKLGTVGYVGAKVSSTATDWDVLLRRFSYILTTTTEFSGYVSGVIGARENSEDLNAKLHIHIFVTQGQSDTLRGTLLSDYIDSDWDELSTEEQTCGEDFSGNLSNLKCYAGDVLVVEVGYRASSVSDSYWGYIYSGGTSTTDLTDNGDATQYPGWIHLDCMLYTAVGKETAYRWYVKDAISNNRQFIWHVKDVIGVSNQALWHTAPPVASLVIPQDGGILQGLSPPFIFGTANPDSDRLHVRLQVSAFRDFRSTIIDTYSATDLGRWEYAPAPYDTWQLMTASGAVSGYRVRYTPSAVLRYDQYHSRVQLVDAEDGIYSQWVYFAFTVSADSAAPLVVTIAGTSIPVSACSIVETTNGDASTINIEVPITEFLAHSITQGAAIAVSSGLGGHSRVWNGTVEAWTFSGTAVSIQALQDDAYLSRKIVTGNKAAADLGANLAAIVDDYGTPLTAENIDTTTGVTMSIIGGYKYLREHLSDALKVLPNYLYWVDETGDIHLVDQSELSYSICELYENNPNQS